MRRITKKTIIFVFGLIFIALYCEFMIYYIVVAQCAWPTLQNIRHAEVLRALIIADTHLLGPFRGHWLDKWRREWQMKQAFQAVITLHQPEVVFVLGDLFDEGEWTDNVQFREYVERFYYLFALPVHIKMYVAVGNHDIGFHNSIRRGSAERFEKDFNAPSVQHIVLKENHFVILNSMALQGDGCRLCRTARNSIEIVSEKLKCLNTSSECYNDSVIHPILLQHFPLYRLSDSVCNEEDEEERPLREKDKPFRIKTDALSREATDYLVSKIKPRAAFGGHTHHGCLLEHSYDKLDDIKFFEYSVPSFSWRNRPDPKYMLVSITPFEYAVNKCGLPKETTIIITAVTMVLMLAALLLKMRLIGRVI